MREFAPDTFTETDVINCLESAGKKFKNGSRYILTQCPTHDDATPSAQIYKDDWFLSCNAGCGRYHITKAYPELRGGEHDKALQASSTQKGAQVIVSNYKTFDLMDDWRKMPKIPRDHYFKNLPLEILDDLGWRWDAEKTSYFIPYFSRSKTTIPFAQWRHLKGERRFTMLKDAKPTCYGTWNIKPGEKLFVVEGTSDCAVLEACLVPWIGLPSASSKELLVSMARFCVENAVGLIYAGDNDDAGDALRTVLEEVSHHRVKQPPKKYKDWGEFYVKEGGEAVTAYCMEELYPKIVELPEDDLAGRVLEVFPSSELVPLRAADEAESKEQSTPPAQLF